MKLIKIENLQKTVASKWQSNKRKIISAVHNQRTNLLAEQWLMFAYFRGELKHVTKIK
jgi:hypothetical protein